MTNHAEEAKRLLQEVDEAVEPLKQREDLSLDFMSTWNSNAMRELAVAQVQATLALVEQQRIANIIALSVPQELPESVRADMIGVLGLEGEHGHLQ